VAAIFIMDECKVLRMEREKAALFFKIIKKKKCQK